MYTLLKLKTKITDMILDKIDKYCYNFGIIIYIYMCIHTYIQFLKTIGHDTAISQKEVIPLS